MGLDMNLYKKKYVGLNYEHNREKDKETKIVINGKEIPTKNLSSLTFDVGYWRKANHIHKWFVENVQDGEDDCKDYYVGISQLKTLLELCKDIREKCPLVEGMIENGQKVENGKLVPVMQEGKIMKNPEYAEELLPTTSGFFFGGTDYDEYYMRDIEHTIAVIEDIITNDNGDDYYYSASW